MESQLRNPYFNHSMIQNVEMFFGRTSLLRRFYASLDSRQSVSLIGQRRIGKSSFLWCASRPEMFNRSSFDLQRHIFVFLDLHDYLHKTSEDFFRSVSKEIITRSAKVANLTLHTESNGADEFKSVLEQVVTQGYFPVLLLDSFDKVTQNEHFGPDFLGFLRAQASRGHVSYVTASLAPLYEVCHQGIAGSPFFNIFHNYTLEALTPDEANSLISKPAEQAGLAFTADEIALVRDLAGRHPFFIQRVSYALFEEKEQLKNNPLMQSVDEQRLSRQTYKDLLPHFKDCWEKLTEEQRIHLWRNTRYHDDRYGTHTIPELNESGLFQQFIAETAKSGLVQINAKELEDILDCLNDPKALGDVSLRYMHVVSQRLELKPSPSTTERGQVIREILYEAFERLRATGVRSDTAPEWLLYNILYYRYFKKRITNEQAAARLCLSVRQFYRERTRAIETLLRVLMEIEQSVMV